METLIVIWGFMGPLLVIGIIGIFYLLHVNKKQSEEDTTKEQVASSK